MDAIYISEKDYDKLITEIDKAPSPVQGLKELFSRPTIFTKAEDTCVDCSDKTCKVCNAKR